MLINDFPLTLKNVKKHGLSINDGWEPLLRNMLVKIEKIISSYSTYKQENCYATQIKEKLGGLRFYMMGISDDISKIIDEAEAKSFAICEYCGNDGFMCISHNFIYKTMCEKCAKKYNYERDVS